MLASLRNVGVKVLSEGDADGIPAFETDGLDDPADAVGGNGNVVRRAAPAVQTLDAGVHVAGHAGAGVWADVKPVGACVDVQMLDEDVFPVADGEIVKALGKRFFIGDGDGLLFHDVCLLC